MTITTRPKYDPELNKIKRALFPKMTMYLGRVYVHGSLHTETRVQIDGQEYEALNNMIKPLMRHTNQNIWLLPRQVPSEMYSIDATPVASADYLKIYVDPFDYAYRPQGRRAIRQVSMNNIYRGEIRRYPDPFAIIYGIHRHVIPIIKVYTKDKHQYMSQYRVGRLRNRKK